MSKLWLLAVLGISAFVTYCIPFDGRLARRGIEAVASGSRISMVGNSVLTHYSKCDEDRRGIAAMVSAELGQKVLDLSYGGQALAESANLAALSLDDPNTRTVIVPLSLFSFAEWDTEPIRTYMGFRLLNPGLYAEGLAGRFASQGWFGGDPSPIMAGFDFRGVHYADYNDIKQNYYLAEKQAMGCPETDGLNALFIAGNYDHAYAQIPILPKNVQLLVSLDQAAQRRGKRLLVALLPIDYALMERLLPEDLPRVRAQAAGVVKALRDGGLTVTDLSDSNGAADFVDRWCACGHLGDRGRLTLARNLAHAVIQLQPPLSARR